MILNIGHRAFGIHSLENSMTAIKKAIDFPLPMIEIDCRLTRDHIPVVFHDSSLKRLASMSLKVSELDLETLNKIHIFSKKENERIIEHEKIPTLEQCLSMIKGKMQLNLELKDNKSLNPILVKESNRLIKQYDMIEDVIVSSFSREILTLLKEENEQIRCGYLFHQRPRTLKKIISQDFYSIHPYKYLVGKRMVHIAKENGLKVFPWTVNSAVLMRKMISLGVDGIITNFPVRLNNILIEKEIKSN